MKELGPEWIKNGKTSKGIQTYLNKITGKYIREEYQDVDNSQKTVGVMMYLKGLSLRCIADILGVSHPTVSKWIQKLEHEYRSVSLVDSGRTFNDVEIDEMWHYCKKKLSKCG